MSLGNFPAKVSESPCTLTIFNRAFAPLIIATDERGTSSSFAKSATSAALALPASAGARTRAFRKALLVESACQPSMALRPPRGVSRTAKLIPSETVLIGA